MPPAPPLAEQTVLITGAATGLGRALATAFTDAGASLILADIIPSDLAAAFPAASLYLADLSSADETRALLADVRAHHPQVHTLIHNAGFLKPQPFADMPEDRWNLTFNLGIQAAYLLTRAFWADWLTTGATAIYLSSRAGIEGSPGEVPYCASKHAIEGFVKSLGTESTPAGIHVHAITPGMYMHTPMSEHNYPAELKTKWVDPILLTPAFLYLAQRLDPTLSGQRLSAWDLSEKVRAHLI